MTPKETTAALREKTRLIKETRQTIHEASRTVCVSVWNSSGRYIKSQIQDPKKWMPFPWEEEDTKDKAQTPDQMKFLMQMFAKSHNREVDKRSKK